MTSPPNRSVLGVISVLILMVLSYILAKLSLRIESNHQFYLTLIPAVVSSFNIVILFACMAFGIVTSIILSVICALIVLWSDFRGGPHGYSIFVLPFFITVFIASWCRKIYNRIQYSYNLESEKLSEKTNIVSNDINSKRRGMDSLEEKLKRYSALKEVIELLSTRLSLDGISALIIDQASKIIGKSGRVLLFMVDVEKQGLRLSASSGDVRVMTKTGDMFDHWVLRHRQSLIVEDVEEDFRFPTDESKKTENTFRTLIAAPLLSENKVIGILRMDSLKELEYSLDDLRLLDILADLGAATVENAILYSKTQELAIKDSLTGLFVRRYFSERFHEEIQRAAMKQGELALIILDIDNFKDYNDKYGHAAGDLVLKYLSKTINGLVREGDIVARYGGEELIILLVGRDKKEAVREAEGIRKTIKDKPLSFRRHVANITISIGLACYPEDGALEEDLMRLADKRLYKAKKLGRDKVCSS